jgi:hypothetical protein
LGFFVALASNVWSISGWTEIRGVYDDICHLRQAHFFRSDPATAHCHTSMPGTKKLVIQYPPGTGFVLALFPQGFQVIPLYVLTSVAAFAFALAATVYASALFSLVLVAGFGGAAIYLMINPTKASYSMAPTMKRLRDRSRKGQAAVVVAGNLVVNLIFFMTHPVFTPYYTIPVAMLSLWTLLFATLIPDREAIGDSLAFRQPVKA